MHVSPLTVVLVAAMGAVIVWWAVAEDPVFKGAPPSSSPPSTASREPDPHDITWACKKAVLNRLKAPVSADFQGMFDDVPEPTRDGDGAYLWQSWVDAQNSYGAKIRNHFQCRFAKGVAMVRMDK
jgi:hypothetical protein